MIDRLLEISLSVKERDTHEAQSEVAGRLGMIACQSTQPSGRDRQRLVEGEFGRKIGHGVGCQRWSIQGTPSGCVGQIGIESAQYRSNPISKTRLLQADSQFVGGDLSQYGHGVVVEVLPASR